MLVCLNEPFEFHVEVAVLLLQNVAVGVESIKLRFEILVSLHDIVIAEPDIVLLLPCDHYLILNLPVPLLSFIHLLLELSVFGIFVVCLPL